MVLSCYISFIGNYDFTKVIIYFINYCIYTKKVPYKNRKLHGTLHILMKIRYYPIGAGA